MTSKIKEINAQVFEQEVLKHSQPVIVYFYSDDCAPCIAFAGVYQRMAEKYAAQMKFVKIHRQQNRQLAESYRIKTSPAVLFLKNGQEVCSRLHGYISHQELKDVIEGVLGGTCLSQEKEKIYADVVILGAGPAGLSAAVYAARAKLYTVVIDESMTGGQVSTTYHVANYPGTNGVIRGLDLMENMTKQALSFGTQIDDMKTVKEVRLEGPEKAVITDDAEYYAKTLIIATGAQPRKLPAEGEKEFRGRGVHYCATCDGAMYQDADVLVVGGGNSAAEEAIFLTRYAKHITMVHRKDRFTASKASADEVLNHPNISVLWNQEIKKVQGETFVTGVLLEDTVTGEQKELPAEGIFVYIGMQPRTEPFRDKVMLDDYGYILTDEDMKTNIPGVFAAGDVRRKNIRQISTAVGDGTIAGIMVEKYINGKQ